MRLQRINFAHKKPNEMSCVTVETARGASIVRWSKECRERFSPNHNHFVFRRRTRNYMPWEVQACVSLLSRFFLIRKQCDRARARAGLRRSETKKRVVGRNSLAFGFEWQWERTQIGIKRIWDELPHSVSKSTVQLFHVFDAESIFHSLFIDWILLRRGWVSMWSANSETRLSSSPLLPTIRWFLSRPNGRKKESAEDWENARRK